MIVVICGQSIIHIIPILSPFISGMDLGGPGKWGAIKVLVRNLDSLLASLWEFVDRIPLNPSVGPASKIQTACPSCSSAC